MSVDHMTNSRKTVSYGSNFPMTRFIKVYLYPDF